MIQVKTFPHCGAPDRASRFDGASTAIVHCSERHEAGASSSTAERLVFTSNIRDILSRSRAALEDHGFLEECIEDSIFLGEIIFQSENVAGRDHRVFVERTNL